MNDYYALADAIQEKLKQAIKLGNKELIQKLNKERDDLDARVKKYGLMPESQLDEISNEKLAQYKTAAALDAGKADKEGDYKRGDKRFSGIVKATKKQFANDTKKSAISQGVSEEFRPTTSQAMNIRKQTTKKMNPGTSKLVWKRPNQISGSHSENELKSLNFKYSTKYNMWGGTQDMWNRLTGALDENVGDHLKSTALDVLVKAKLEIERQREADLKVKSDLEIERQRQQEADIEAWKQDFQKNTVQKAQHGLRKEFQQDYYGLKDKLVQLDIVIKKHKEVDDLIKAIKKTYRHHIVATKMDDLDNRLLQDVKAGAADNYNYKSLLIKLTQLLPDLANQYPTAVEYLAKKKGVTENHDERDEYDNPRQGRDYGKGNLFVDPGSNEFKKEVRIGSNDGERGRPKKLKGISTSLPADPFGRTTGKIPASARPTSKEDPFKEVDEEKQRLDPKCWTGYKKQGTKMKGDTRVNNCVPIKETNSHILLGLQQVDEGWKEKLGAAALAGSMALGSAGAQARVTPDGQGGVTGGLKPAATATDGLVHADSADRQAQTITVGGKEYGLVEISPTDIRPRSGQRIVVPQAVLGERGIGNYMGILVGNRVFVISK
jgi:hypothetical protein